jgi:asparagine synthase (glutamine-hydrolysing)
VAGFLLQTVRIVNQTETWFNNIERLPPAHMLSVDRSGLRTRRYWKPDPCYELHLASDSEYADAFEERLDKAVQDRLRNQGTSASMLSGGMDSSTIVGLASRQLAAVGAGLLPTYSGISDESDCIESGYIRKAIAHCAVEPSLTRPSEMQLFERELKSADDVSLDPADYGWSLLSLMFLRAKADGHSVLLSGVDGDLVASLGPDYPAYLLRCGRVRTAVRELQGQHQRYYRSGKTTLAEYRHLFRRAMVPAALRRLKKPFTLTGALQKMARKSLISDSLLETVDLRARLLTYLEVGEFDLSPSLRHSHVMQIDDPHLAGAAELYGRLASGFGMECRHPLLDKRLVEFCVSLPWDQKCRDGWSKYAMRQVAARVLPQEVAWRPGFEEIGWKFTAARSQLNREEELDMAPDFARAYQSLVSVEKVDQRVRRLQKQEVEYDQQLLEFLGLARWLGRLGIHRL